ncbi:hypothetical protein CCAX7_18440 [Capsulimonas corticalis]|uniref:Uncharacterized protein n=1 Tax=Capsulimonas corticalis TaxID=2219043 RepID=A0A402D5G1_9BACT|nr:hypothetical protein [Capsulimonas corticalis]BDI29793.1 hypothetical protein CCAX7_18440 [Capsulimonas corticalis]
MIKPRIRRCTTLAPLGILAFAAFALPAARVDAAGSPDLVWMRPGAKHVGDVAVSPDGKLLALVTGDAASPNIKLIRRADGVFLHMIRLSYPALAVTFSPDSHTLAVRCHVADFQTDTPSYYLFRVSDGGLIRAFPALGLESANPLRDDRITFTPDGKQLVTDELSFDQSVVATSIYNVLDGSLQPPAIAGYAPGSLAADLGGNLLSGAQSTLAPDGSLRFSFLSDGTAALWSPANGAYLGSGSFQVSGGPWTNPVYLSPQLVAFGGPQGLSTLSLASLSGGAPPHVPVAFDAFMNAKALWTSPDANRTTLLALGSVGGSPDVLRVYRKLPGASIPAPLDLDISAFEPLGGAAITPEASSYFVSGVALGFPCVFEINALGGPGNSSLIERSLLAHAARANGVAYSPDGQIVVTGGDDGRLCLWSAADGSLIRTDGIHEPIEAVAISPSGRFVAYAVSDKVVTLDRTNNSSTYVSVTEPFRLAFSPDGGYLVAVTGEPQVRVWSTSQLATGGMLQFYAVGGFGTVQDAVFSPDSATVAIKSLNQLYFWTIGGSYPAPIDLGSNAANGFGLAYSPDGSRLAVGGDRDVSLVDTAAHTVVKTLHDPVAYGTAYVSSVAYRPDGGLLLSAHADGAVRAWNAAAGTLLQTYSEDTGVRNSFGLLGIAAAPNGCDFAYCWDDGSVSLANMPGPTPLKVTLDTSATAASATYSSVLFHWTTNLPADSQSDIGLSLPPYEAGTPLDSARVTTHTQTMTGLIPATTYHYRVRSTDARGVTRDSEDATFTTRAAPTPSQVVFQVPSGYGGVATVVGVTLTTPADENGVQVAMSSSDAQMIPAGTKLTIPPGASGAWLKIVPTAVSANTVVSVSATLNAVTKTATLPINPPLLTALSTIASVAGGQPLAVKATLQGAAPAGGLIVPVSSPSSAIIGGSITIPAGATSGTTTLATRLVNANTPVTLTATSNGTSRTVSVTVQPTIQSIAFAAAGGYGGVSTSVGVSLYVPAGPNGVTIALSSPGSTLFPAGTTVTIPAGAYGAWIRCTPAPVASATVITATATLGSVSRSATYAVNAPALTSFVPASSVLGGQPLSARVTLTSPAPAGGALVSVTSNSPAITGGAVTVPAGATTATALLTTHPVSAAASVTLTAAWKSVSLTGNVAVQPSFQSIVFAAASGYGGASTSLGVALYTPAGPGGLTVTLSSSDTKMIPAGTTLTIPTGSYSAWMRVTPSVVVSDTAVTATAALGSFTKSATYTVKKNP